MANNCPVLFYQQIKGFQQLLRTKPCILINGTRLKPNQQRFSDDMVPEMIYLEHGPDNQPSGNRSSYTVQGS